MSLDDSCFPLVPKLACQVLGIPIEKPQKPITLLGGLTFFAGAGGNYSILVGTITMELAYKSYISPTPLVGCGGDGTPASSTSWFISDINSKLCPTDTPFLVSPAFLTLIYTHTLWIKYLGE